MTQKEARAESSGRRFPRAGWIVGGALLAVVAFLVFQWTLPRPIQIPLRDGTTLTILEVTTGTDHSRSLPIPQRYRTGNWRWPAYAAKTPVPATVLWFDDPNVTKTVQLAMVDRHGWRWMLESGGGNATGYAAAFRQIETDGTARLEVWGRKIWGTEGLLGSTVFPLPTAVPVTAPASAPATFSSWKFLLPPAPPPIFSNREQPDPYPIRQTNGLLEATLRSVDVRIVEKNGSLSLGELRLETRWNSQPFAPQLGSATITDRFGRSDSCLFNSQQFEVVLPPQDAVWTLHLQIYRSLDMPLDPEEIVHVTPEFPDGATFFSAEGSLDGTEWRVTVDPSGRILVPSRYESANLVLEEDVPVLVVEVDPQRPIGVRIEPVDHQGNLLPTAPISRSPLPHGLFALRCPAFDATQGHTLRVGLESPRLVQFRFRPNVVPAEKGKSSEVGDFRGESRSRVSRRQAEATRLQEAGTLIAESFELRSTACVISQVMATE